MKALYMKKKVVSIVLLTVIVGTTALQPKPAHAISLNSRVIGIATRNLKKFGASVRPTLRRNGPKIRRGAIRGLRVCLRNESCSQFFDKFKGSEKP